MERLSALLKVSLDKGLFSGGHDYRADPFNSEFRASQAPYCSRKLVFSSILDWKAGCKLQEKGDSGTLIHHLIQSLLEASGLSVVNEESMELQLINIKMFGHMDILLIEYEEYLICIDIKTSDNFSFIDSINDASDHHKEQLTVYLSYLIKRYPKKIVLGVIWYVLRMYYDEQLINMLERKNWRLYFVDYSPECWNDIVKKLENITKCLKKGILPSFDNEKWECANKTAICPYLDLCFSEKEKITTTDELFDIKRKENHENNS